MFQHLNHRGGHYLLLLLAGAALMLPNLGVPSLWDIDEGNNAEAASEMLRAGDWITPTFNYQLRVDKPALLYWMQIASYRLCGVNELGARLPSALMAILTLLLTYELGRRLFDAGTGLLAGLVLASAIMFCAAGHFANPDALLTACTVLTFLVFWSSFASGGRGWLIGTAVVMGLAVLAKGPVGFLLPAAVIGLFLLWSRQLGRLRDRRLLLGLVVFLAVALPWYVLVGVRTQGNFLDGFLMQHNVKRFLAPMENHAGPVYYYLVVLLLGFLPWSVFLGPTAWHAVREARSGGSAQVYQFLAVWIAIYFVFFTAARTKLPNYVLPAYPALALLVGRFLSRWLQGAAQPASWLMNLSWLGLILLGTATAAGLVLASGRLQLPIPRAHVFPGAEVWAIIGIAPILGGLLGWWWNRHGRRGLALAGVSVAVFIFIGVLAGWGASSLETYKAPRALIAASQARQLDQDIRIGCFDYFQPSLVFYSGREVHRLWNENAVVDFLHKPLPVYLFLPEAAWGRLQPRVTVPCRVLGKRHDLFRKRDVVVVTNQE